MIMPTIKNLEQCKGFKTIKNLLDHQQKLTNKDIPPILPKFLKKMVTG